MHELLITAGAFVLCLGLAWLWFRSGRFDAPVSSETDEFSLIAVGVLLTAVLSYGTMQAVRWALSLDIGESNWAAAAAAVVLVPVVWLVLLAMLIPSAPLDATAQGPDLPSNDNRHDAGKPLKSTAKARRAA